MPPKSSSSKKNQISWFCCEKCSTNIIIKDRNGHEKTCDKFQNGDIFSEEVLKTDFVRDGVLHTSTIEKRTFAVEELKDVSEKQLNNLVFVSEGVMKLCKFSIGQDLLVSTNADEQQVSIKLNYFGNTFRRPNSSKGSHSSSLNISNLNFKDVEKKISKILQIELRGKVVCENTKIFLDFFNKEIEIVLENFFTHLENEGLSEKMENLSLNEKFYLFTNSTRMILYEKNGVLEDLKQENVEKVKLKDIGGLEEQVRQVFETFGVALGFKNVPKVGIMK
uniref:Uncharacterized protein n=1 Tax=Megaselia scalaris TaxID=36166 RepID=T1GNG6_MEGSC